MPIPLVTHGKNAGYSLSVELKTVDERQFESPIDAIGRPAH